MESPDHPSYGELPEETGALKMDRMFILTFNYPHFGDIPSNSQKTPNNFNIEHPLCLAEVNVGSVKNLISTFSHKMRHYS